MRRILYDFRLPLFFACFILLFSCKDKETSYDDVPEKNAAKDSLTKEERIKRGEYLITMMGCHDCHSPKKMGERGPELIGERLLSGHQAGSQLPPISKDALDKGWMLFTPDLTAAAGPWGVSYAANLTSHETGIGTWKFENFKRALTEGKLKGQPNGRSLLPPMPWQNFENATDEDLRDMFEYLKSTNPVDNAVPAPIPPNQLDSLARTQTAAR